MYPSKASWVSRWLTAVFFCLVCSTLTFSQSTGGRILGRVADPSGAVLAGVKVTLVNEDTGVSRDSTTNDSGDYGFPEVPVGNYRAEFDLAGFKKNVRHGILLQLNQVLTLNLTMQIGETKEVVEVTSEAPLVDTTSTQLGTVVNDRAIAQLPLNQRDTYQFLSLQPGVQSQVGADLYYGGGSSGSVSVNGGRGRANNFSVNGGDANDSFVNLPTVQPSPDSVEEFRIITNSFDAEYGRNSGSVVNVVTKSGTNQFHGNVYEFFRNKVLNSKGYFDTSKGKYSQNQFGGTLGGPIRKDRTFFFGSYEGNRVREGQSGDRINVPDGNERKGVFAGAFAGSIQNPFVGSLLLGRPGCQQAIQSAGGSIPDPNNSNNYPVAWSSVFPQDLSGNTTVPLACQDAVASDLLRFIPQANIGTDQYQAVLTGRTRQDQATLRLDHRINEKQNLTGYYYFTDVTGFTPFNFFQAAGANVGGFGANSKSRYQQINISHTWTLTNAVVNEARFTYMREGQRTFNHPEKTNNVIDSCTSVASAFCFTGHSDSLAVNTLDPSGQGNPKFGITPGLGPGHEGVPDIAISGGAVIGNNFEGELPQVGNSFQWTDNVTVVKGNHTIKFGGDVRRMRFDQALYFEVSGYYQYFGGGPNDPMFGDLYPNYLLGLPDSYQQGSAQTENVRSSSVYLYGQDSWKIGSNVTLNYGVRWELNTPLNEIGHRVQTFRPGQATQIYPCLQTGSNDCASEFPTGLVFPGDKGVPNGLTQTYYKAFAPRVGIAWDPWKDGKTSIRAGWGMFYNPIEQLVLEQFSAEPPFGISLATSNILFNTPFIGQDGTVSPNGAGGILSPPRGKPLDWSVYRPILLFGEFQPHMRSQYSDQYNFNIQRELTKDLQLQVGYVGSQGHRLLASHDINPGNPQTCLDLNSTLGTGTCGPFSEDNSYFVPATAIAPAGGFHVPYGSTGPTVIPAGSAIGSVAPNGLTLAGIRRYSSPNCDPMTAAGCPPDSKPVFTNIFAEDTTANSAYNSLQASLLKRFSHGLQAQLAYTWSKSMDQASSFEDFLDPFNPKKTRSLSLYDARHRFVVSYVWEVPIPKKSGLAGAILNGWAVSGITQFQAGFPIHIQSYDDQDLTGNAGIGFSSPTVPDQIARFHKLDPHNAAHLGFDPNSFTANGTDNTQPLCSAGALFNCYDPSLLGRSGTAKRTICCGPGLNNSDLSLQKNNKINERFRSEFRLDIFNIANHTKFFNPDGNTTDGSDFGRVKRVGPPRLMQFALKLYF